MFLPFFAFGRVQVWGLDEKPKKDIATILKAYKERPILRGLERFFSVARQQVAFWIREHVQALSPVKTTLLPAKPEEVLEFDEAWSFVLKKGIIPEKRGDEKWQSDKLKHV